MRTQVPVTVTSHGRPRAVITPIDVAHSHRESLVADGVLTPGSGRVWDVPPVPASVSTEDALAAERAEWR
ncbi:hypothetical protein Bcav_3383 [Beutenbergia cavernae DSM 12333]|uniref:Prevent-host-death family protein n=2 Tax=Beutenbergia TaxID=84756 RepID=C5C200_BEUC1|nr:hypothetical protein Bcav_3383 [Beutenbergia cavernae DSM 12333]